jgi:hypothetical protein
MECTLHKQNSDTHNSLHIQTIILHKKKFSSIKFTKVYIASVPILQNSSITEMVMKGQITCFQIFSTCGHLK